MEKYQQKEMNKIRRINNTWYDWFINYIAEPIRKCVDGFQDNIVSLFQTKTPNQIMYGRGKKLSKPKTQNKIKNIRNPFILKKKK